MRHVTRGSSDSQRSFHTVARRSRPVLRGRWRDRAEGHRRASPPAQIAFGVCSRGYAKTIPSAAGLRWTILGVSNRVLSRSCVPWQPSLFTLTEDLSAALAALLNALVPV